MTEEKQDPKNRWKVKMWGYSILFFLTCLFLHYLLYLLFWVNDPVFTNASSMGTFFMRVGALASVLLIAIDLLLISFLLKLYKRDSKKENSVSSDEYTKYQLLAKNIKWISGLFLFINTLTWGFGDLVFQYLVR